MLRICLMLSFAVVLAIGCDNGGRGTAAKDAGGTDRSVDITDPGDVGSDGSNQDAGSTPMPCAQDGPPIELVCNGYCTNLNTACTAANMQFASFAACVDACTAPTWSCGTPTDPTGNTIFCRINHAMAATAAPDTECAQAGPSSASCI